MNEFLGVELSGPSMLYSVIIIVHMTLIFNQTLTIKDHIKLKIKSIRKLTHKE